MTVATADTRLDAAAPSGPLGQEARALRRRAEEIRTVAKGMRVMDDAQFGAVLEHVLPLISHIAAHGDAEEHIVYPYIQGGCDTELAALRDDHAKLKELARSIAEWKSGQDRAAVRRLIEDFCDISAAHFVVEGEVCMPVIHSRITADSEQLLFEAVESEVFEADVDQRPRSL